MRRRLRSIAAVVVLLVAACDTTSTSSPSGAALPGEVPIGTDCGPVTDIALCHDAIQVAAAARQNPPPIASVRIRRPNASDDCTTDFHPCRAGDIIVDIQSGDVIESIALVRSGGRWILLSQIR